MEKIIPYAFIFWQYFYAGCMILVSSMSQGFLELIDSYEKKDVRHHKASFATDRDFINESNRGFVVNGIERISRLDSFEGVMLTGAIGSGKGINVIIPNIARLADGSTSIIIHDPSGEAMMRTSGYVKERNYDIHVFRWFDPAHSDFYNPLDYVRDKSEAYKTAKILIDGTLGKSSSDPFWSLQAITALYCFIALTLKLEPQFRTLYNTRHLLIQFSIDPEKIHPLFVAKADNELMETYLSIVALEDKVLRSVIATALAGLGLWADDNIVRITSQKSSVDFRELRSEKPKCIYILNHTTDARVYAPLINLLFDQLSAALFEWLPDPKSDHDVMFVMDEMSSIHLKNLPTILNNCRKHRVGFLCAYQSSGMIRASYPNDWEAVMSSLRTKIWLGGQGLESSKQLEELIGREEVEDAKGRITVRSLMPSEDIRLMRPDEGLVISPFGRCYKVQMHPYFAQTFLNLKMKRPSFAVSKALLSHVPLTAVHAKDKKK
jgi:type IV secretory pathway TraG/TraD family ATPase VirD4